MGWWKQSPCCYLLVSSHLSLWGLCCSSLLSIIAGLTEDGIDVVPCACLGLSKYQFITNLALQGTIHWHVRTLQFTQCSLLWKESHDWISKQKESHNMFLELLIKITASWQERHMVDLRCMTTVTAFHFFLKSHFRAGGERQASEKPPTWEAIWWGVSAFRGFLFHCLPLSPCNTTVTKCHQSNWLPEIFF